MFKTLLLATVAGAGAANVPAPELIARGNRHSICTDVNQRCSRSKAQASVTAYCSSLIKATPVTKTVRTTLYGTTTTTKTSVVATVTQPGSVITSTITSCAPPTTTAAGADNQKREAEAEAEPQYGYRHIPKPKCLDCYKKDSDVTSACQCAVTPSTTTITSTYKMTVEKTATVSATSTVTGSASTTYVLPTQSLAVADDSGRYYQTYEIRGGKEVESGMGFKDDNISNALLFELNSANNLADSDGNLASEFVTSVGEGIINRNSYRVTTQDPSDIQYKPITCSVSYSPSDNTCPLVCQASSAADRNISPNLGDVTWYLGAPNSIVGTDTYKTHAVTRGESTGRGGRGGISQRRAMHRRA